MRKTLRPLVAELVGTFFLVFCGVGAAVSDLYRTGSVGLLGVAVANGVALAVGVTATLNVSGGFLNPAVTLAMWTVRRIEAVKALWYIVAELLGGLLAVAAIKFLYPEVAAQISIYGAPHLAPDVQAWQGILIEAVLTFLLAFAIMGTAVDPRAPKIGGLGIGFIVMCDVLAGGQMTGAAMNPSRAFMPMVMGWLSGVGSPFTGAGIYWVGPILGAVAGIQLYERMIMKENEAGGGSA